MLTVPEHIPERPRYYTRDGEPLPSIVAYLNYLHQCKSIHGHYDPSRVGVSRCGPLRVSTIWLGLDLYPESSFPRFFETMVFLSGRPMPGWTRRYGTLDDALRGHSEVTACVYEVVTDIAVSLKLKQISWKGARR